MLRVDTEGNLVGVISTLVPAGAATLPGKAGTVRFEGKAQREDAQLPSLVFSYTQARELLFVLNQCLPAQTMEAFFALIYAQQTNTRRTAADNVPALGVTDEEQREELARLAWVTTR